MESADQGRSKGGQRLWDWYKTTASMIDLPAGGMLGFRKNDGRFFIHDDASAAIAQVPFNPYR